MIQPNYVSISSRTLVLRFPNGSYYHYRLELHHMQDLAAIKDFDKLKPLDYVRIQSVFLYTLPTTCYHQRLPANHPCWTQNNYLKWQSLQAFECGDTVINETTGIRYKIEEKQGSKPPYWVHVHNLTTGMLEEFHTNVCQFTLAIPVTTPINDLIRKQ